MDLRMYLKSMGIRQNHFAKKIGISITALSMILNGRAPNLRIALAIELATDGAVRCRELIPTKIQQTIANKVKGIDSSEESPDQEKKNKKRRTKKKE